MNIAPSKNRDAIRLQFTVEGVRFSFSPVPGGKWENKHDRQLATAIANKIENDVRAGNFDSTLQKYRHNAFCTQSTGSKVPEPRADKTCWLEIWDGFVQSLRLTPATAADHYACVRAQILKAQNPSVAEIGWFVDRTDLAASTFNRRLKMLAKAADWAINQKKITRNPLTGIEGRSQTLAEEEQEESKKAPFNAVEVSRIISYFYEKHPTYAPFVEFLLFSGVRTGEAVGLRWCDVDLERQTIAIEQSLSRERGGYRKIAKRPKTLQSRRLLKMSVRVYELFLKIKNAIYGEKELVFKSPNGCEIDHGNFRSSYWKPALAALKIAYRKPYATRHTLLSKALESGLSVPQVAAIAGHKNSRMVIQHYGRQINQPQLPD